MHDNNFVRPCAQANPMSRKLVRGGVRDSMACRPTAKLVTTAADRAGLGARSMELEVGAVGTMLVMARLAIVLKIKNGGENGEAATKTCCHYYEAVTCAKLSVKRVGNEGEQGSVCDIERKE